MHSLTSINCAFTDVEHYATPTISATRLSLWLTGTVLAEPETVISRAWVQSPDPAE